MSKEKEEKKVEGPFGQFDLLKMDTKSSPFGDPLEMIFTEENDPKEIVSVKNPS